MSEGCQAATLSYAFGDRDLRSCAYNPLFRVRMRWVSVVKVSVVAAVAAAAFALVTSPARRRSGPRCGHSAREREAGPERPVAGHQHRQLGHPGAHRQGGAGDASGPGRAGPRQGSAGASARSAPSQPAPAWSRATSCPTPPEALKKKQENQENWLTRDPEIKCYLPGVPRATYMPFPFQIVQSNARVLHRPTSTRAPCATST